MMDITQNKNLKMSIDELVCEFNVFFIEVILKEDFFEYPFFCNKEYKSYPLTD